MYSNLYFQLISSSLPGPGTIRTAPHEPDGQSATGHHKGPTSSTSARPPSETGQGARASECHIQHLQSAIAYESVDVDLRRVRGYQREVQETQG